MHGNMEYGTRLTAEHLGEFTYRQVIGWNVKRKWGTDDWETTKEALEIWHTKHTMARRKKLVKLFNRQDGKCCYCGVECELQEAGLIRQGKKGKARNKMATLEHIKPQSLGGTDSMRNLLMACHLCNNTRGVLDHDFFMEVRSDPEKWHEYNKKQTKHFQELSVEKKARKELRQQTFVWKLALLLYYVPEWKAAFAQMREEISHMPDKQRRREQVDTSPVHATTVE